MTALFERLKRCGFVGDVLWKFEGYFQFVLSASCLGFKMWALSRCSSSHACLLLPCFPTAMDSHPSGSRSPEESLHMQVAWVMVFHYSSSKGTNTTSKVSFYCWRNSCPSTPVSWFPLNYIAIVVSYYNKIPHRCFQNSGLGTSSSSVPLQMSLDLCSGSFLARTCTRSYLQSSNP